MVVFVVLALQFGYGAEVSPNRNTVVLPTVNVEGQIQETNRMNIKVQPISPAVDVAAGQGSKILDPPINNMGVSLKAMDEELSLVSERESKVWWVNAAQSQSRWTSQSQFQVGAKSLFKVRLLHAEAELSSLEDAKRFTIEVGQSSDHRLSAYRENTVDPFDVSKGEIKHWRNHNEKYYFQFHNFSEPRNRESNGTNEGIRPAETLVEIDKQTKFLQLGATPTGWLKKQHVGIGGVWNGEQHRLLSFLQIRNDEFFTQTSSLSSSSTEGARFGLLLDFPNPDSLSQVVPGITLETLSRQLEDESPTHFQRLQIQLHGAKIISRNVLDSRIHWNLDLARDEVSQQKPMTEPLASDFGIALSSSKTRVFGWEAQWRRFALLPSPIQRFGDGVLLKASPQLRQERGWRAAFGPWWQTLRANFDLNVFFEETVNEPIVVATSPWSAKTLGLGSVIVRGAEAKVSNDWRPFKLDFIYSFQEATNNSAIRWQRGHQVPGRPQHSIISGMTFQRRRWKSGLDYKYKSPEAMDLSGLWHRSAQHSLNGFIAFKKKNWELRLIGENMLAKINDLPTSLASGQAGVDLLEPTIEQTEIKVACEILL
jgi:hypothetical protein